MYGLKKAIAAVLYHCSDAETIEQRHQFCPPTETWCKYQLDLIKGTSLYKHKPGIPEKIRKLLKPMFMALSDDKLLEKCMHRKTQNNNECLNMVIWKRCPKDVYVGQHTLEMGVCSAILSFNDGIISIVSNGESWLVCGSLHEYILQS